MVDTFEGLFQKVLSYTWPVQGLLPGVYPVVGNEVDVPVKDSSVRLASFLGLFVEFKGVT